MAGVACLEQILKFKHDFDITIFGDETHANYNRIMLSSVLAGEKSAEEIILNDTSWYQANGIHARLGVRVASIDSARKVVVDEQGGETSFDSLILATGSGAFVPPIPGVDKKNVYVFRTLDDTRAMLDKSRPGLKAIVIGGGLLGLEAARGLQVQGCDVTVLHITNTLMDRQLDTVGGGYLKRSIEALGVSVLTGKQTTAILGNGKVQGLQLACGTLLDAELVVIAAGIRPNVELGRSAGLEVNRGIVVNDFMETSSPGIFAVGECTEHRGETFGLVAPLFEQGKVLAATITGNRGPVFQGSSPAAKLKIMGVDVFSAGDTSDTDPAAESIRYEDSALGIYKKLIVKDNRLLGVILVGDASDDHRYKDWLNNATDLAPHRRHLLFPPPATDQGLDVAAMPDGETVCGCMGVSKGDIVAAIQVKGISTIAQLKDATRASTGCGSCTQLCSNLLRAVAPGFEEEKPKGLCACVPFTQEKLRDIIRAQKLKSVQDVLDIYGNGCGCEVCKPALS